MAAIAFSTAIGPVSIDCVISERPNSELQITEIPIESGARITDHAVLAPKKLTLEIANGNVAESFRALVAFQESRVPFTIVTGLNVFNNMLIKSINPERDATFSRILRASIDLQEAIIVETAYDPGATGATGSSRGQAGKTRSTTPSAARSGDAATSDKAAGPVNRGDTGGNAPTPQNRSILDRGLFGG